MVAYQLLFNPSWYVSRIMRNKVFLNSASTVLNATCTCDFLVINFNASGVSYVLCALHQMYFCNVTCGARNFVINKSQQHRAICRTLSVLCWVTSWAGSVSWNDLQAIRDLYFSEPRLNQTNRVCWACIFLFWLDTPVVVMYTMYFVDTPSNMNVLLYSP